MKRFVRITYPISLLLALLIVPSVHAQDSSDQILYTVGSDNGDNTVYTVNVDNGLKTQIGTVHGQLGMGHDAGWSPDGKFIYLLDSQELEYPTLTFVDVETNQRQTIPDALEGYSCTQPFLWSPTGEWIAYSTHSDSQTLLKLFNPTTGDTQTVATLHSSFYPLDERGWSAAISWSYDAHYLSYRDYEPDNYHTTIYDVQNRRTVDVPSGSWSPTENKLAYMDDAHAIIYNFVDGTKQQYKAASIGEWSPDGRFLTIYQVDKDEHKTFSVIDVRANKLVNLEGESPILDFDTQFTWSPDGHFLVMTIQDEQFGYKATAYVLDVLKGGISRLDIETEVNTPFKWSPVGNELILATDAVEFEGSGDVAGGSNYTALWWFDFDQHQSYRYAIEISTSAEYFFGQIFDWFANGRYIIIQAIPQVLLLDKSTQKLSPIGDTTPFYIHHWWANGKRIVMTSLETNESEIYLLKPETNTLVNITNTPDKFSIFLGWRGDKNQRSLILCGE